MKKLVLALVVVFVLCGSVFAGDITLNTPETVLKPATLVRTYAIVISPVAREVVAVLNWHDEDGKIVKQEQYKITDWSEITSPAVPASCSDVQWETQVDCEGNGGVWTPAVPATVVNHTDASDLLDAVIGAGVVGQKYVDVIEKAVRNKVKALKSINGTVE